MMRGRLGTSSSLGRLGPWTWRTATVRGRALLALAAMLASCLIPTAGWSLGGVQVAPTRIVFEGRDRTAELSVINGGTATGTYRIWFKNLRMNQDGTFEEIAASATDRPAEDLVRYAPRRITLRPGQSQTVRLLLRKPAGLAPGEYRSHLMFAEVPAPSQMDRAVVLGDPDAGLVVQLRPIFGVSIPVIVRHGDLSANVRLTDLQLERTAGGARPTMLTLRIERTGAKSVFGDLEATLVPDSGAPRVVGRVRGIAVYATTPWRTVRLPLSEVPPGSELRVTYREPSKDGGSTLAATVLPR